MKNKHVVYLIDDKEFLSQDNGTTSDIYEAKTFNTIEEAQEYYNELDWNSQVFYMQVRE